MFLRVYLFGQVAGKEVTHSYIPAVAKSELEMRLISVISGVQVFFTLTVPETARTVTPFRAQWIILKCHYVTMSQHGNAGRSLPWKNESPSSTSFSSCGRFGSALNSFTKAWKVKGQFTGQRDKKPHANWTQDTQIVPKYDVLIMAHKLIGVNSSVDWKLQSFFKWGLRKVRGILTKHPSSWRLDTIRSQASTAYAYGALEFLGGN